VGLCDGDGVSQAPVGSVMDAVKLVIPRLKASSIPLMLTVKDAPTWTHVMRTGKEDSDRIITAVVSSGNKCSVFDHAFC
jgi:hypothetical protein